MDAFAGLDMEANLDIYLGEHKPKARYSSFDYYFNYFQVFRETGQLGELANDTHLQTSCLQLGLYLASWGMLRGSAQLLQRSARIFVPVVEAISSAPPQLWTVDVDNYSDGNIATILDYAKILRSSLHDGASNILLTKVMLGVFGCVPAFDDNFKRGFGATTFGPKSLRRIRDFYKEHKPAIDSRLVPPIDFDTELPTKRLYTRAKVIEMIFFIEGDLQASSSSV